MAILTTWFVLINC